MVGSSPEVWPIPTLRPIYISTDDMPHDRLAAGRFELVGLGETNKKMWETNGLPRNMI